MRNTHRGLSPSLKACGLGAWLLVAIAAGAAWADSDHAAAPAETPPAVRVAGEDLTQSLVRLDAKRRRGGAGAAALARQMRDTAAKRADLLAELIADHPAEVLRLALPARLRARMPAEVQALLEQRQEIEGELEVLHIDMPDPAQSRFAYFLTTELGERFSLHFAHGAPKFLTGAKVSVDGLLLPRSAPDTGDTDGAMAVESGETNVEYLGGDGGSSTGGTSTPPILPNTFGEQRTLVIMVNFQDKPSEQPWTAQQVHDAVFSTTDAFFRENSWQQTWLTGDVYGWYTIPVLSTVCDLTAIQNYSDAAAVAAGVDLSAYSRIAYFFPLNSGCGWSGAASVGGNPSRASINGTLDQRVVNHEFGHTLGLRHAHGLECDTTSLGTNCSNYEYGDPFDVMGQRNSYFGAFHKDRLGWLGYAASPPLTTVTASGTYTLTPYETGDATPKALKILKSTDPVTGARTWYYVEFRQAIGADAWMSSNPYVNALNGVVIRTGKEDDGNSSNLLDMTPNSDAIFDWFDSALTVGKTFSDPNAGVTITTLSAASTGAIVDVSVTPAVCVEADPLIAMTPSESQWVAAGTPVAYTVTVTNKDDTACANATFTLTDAVPSGWTGTYDSSSLTLAPGASGSRTLTVTSPASAADGFYTVTATAMNGTTYAGSTTATYVVSNPTANQPPVANNDSAATQSGMSVIIPVLANDSDPDGDALTVASATQGSGGTVVVNADNTLTYTAAASFAGIDSFSYSVSDGRGGSDSAVVTVTVTAVNYPPTAVNDSATTHAGKLVNIAVLANDSDANGDVLSVTSTSTPKYGTVVVNPDMTVSYTPVSWYVGTDSFTYAIADGKGGTASASVTVTMTNTAAVAVDDSAATKAGVSVIIRVLANDYDPDRDPIYVKSVTQGGKGMVTINADNTVTYTPGTRFRGSDSFTYTIGDGHGGVCTATVTVTRLR